MAGRDWNEGQKAALTAKGKNILVSAAAGSGKTSVLTERVIRHIIDERCDIREMLVVTFSTAAAAEMKERIFSALQDAAAEHGPRLLRQSELLIDADISTLHSFCSRVIRENFEQAGVSPNFYTLSAGEADLLREEAMEELFDALYEEQDEDFLRLVRRYGGRSDANLKAFLFRLHEYFVSLVDPAAWFEEKLSMQSGSAFTAALQKDFDRQNEAELAEAAFLFMHSAQVCRANGFSEMAAAEEENAAAVRYWLELYRKRGREAFKEAYDAEKGFEKAKYKGMPGELKDYIDSVRKDAKEILKGIAENEYIVDFSGKVQVEIDHTLPDLMALKKLYGLFHARYEEFKEEKNALDFSDLEHKALEALKEAPVRRKYAEKYRYIFVDEYQDTNPVQEEILNRICRPDNRFMVGDLKQSIYRFRQADPMIFKEKSVRYCKDGADGCLVRMNENFRSCAEIIDFVNYCMENLMSEQLGDITYGAGEALAPGRIRQGGTVSLVLAAGKDRFTETGSEEEAAEEEELSQSEREAHIIAGEILKAMEGVVYDEKAGGERKTEYGDIAVLLREVKNTGKVMKMVFQNYGIPAFVEAEAVLSEFPEVESFIDLLRIVDHFSQDIPLLSVMRSGYGGFSARELAGIRIYTNDADIPFHKAVLRYAAECGDALGEKLKAFLRRIERLKTLSLGMRTEEFLLFAEKETGFGEILSALKGGGHKYASLAGILENAGEAGQNASESLHAFIRYIEDMQRTGRLSDMLKPQGGKNTVKILSIHKSKGLEFPIVFLPRLNKRINLRETTESMLICRDIGVALQYVDEKRLIRRDTYLKRLAAANIKKASLSEELRVLYVAMTRTKQHLTLSGSVNKLGTNVLKWLKPRTPHALLRCNSALEWLMPLLLKMEGARDMLLCPDFSGIAGDTACSLFLNARVADVMPPPAAAGGERKIKFEQFIRQLPEDTLAALSYRYPHAGDLTVPSKRSVTDIKKSETGGAYTKPLLPPEEEGGMTAAQRGTITHYVLRYIDFSEGADIQKLIENLQSRALLSPEEAAEVDTEQLKTFLNSGIARRIRASASVYREMPFCLRMDAQELGYEGAGETVVVQGVIDLCFLENGGWVIVDYKTDRVDEATAAEAAQGYKKQLDLYERALADITRIPVVEKYIYFLRAGLYAV